MTSYTITLTAAEEKALSHVTHSIQDWIDNVVHERCRLAIEEIVTAEVQRRLSAGETISGTKDDIVMAAPIKSLAELEAERMATAQEVIAEKNSKI